MAGILASAGLSAPAAMASSQRVPDDYFGTNLQNPYALPPEVRDRQIASIAATGMTQVRIPVPWSAIEPEPPVGGEHGYRWEKVDPQIQALARYGLQAQALLAYAPPWASNATPQEVAECREDGAAGLGTGSPEAYAKAARALAARYGPGGKFWEEHPDLDPQPIRLYEIWNAPNTAGAWCPRVDPELYAQLFVRAAEEIRRIIPGATIVLGGVGIGARTQGGSIATDDYLKQMMAAKPSIRSIADAVGAHIYPGPRLERQLQPLVMLRTWLREAGIPDSTPMLLNEIGFSRVGELDMTEPERTASYEQATKQLPRVNCNLSGVLQYTWASREQNLNDTEDWYGVADPATGQPYPSGQEYVKWTQIFTGNHELEAPRSAIDLCPGMPKPDQDRDGVPDENDEYPLDPDRSDPDPDPGPGPGPGPDPGPGPGPDPGPGPGPDPGDGDGGARCSERMFNLTQKMATTQGAKRKAAKRRYVKVQRRCVPCKRKLAQINRKMSESDGAKKRNLKARHRRVKKKCSGCVGRLDQLEMATLGASETEKAEYLRRHERTRKRCTGSKRR